MTLGLIMKSKRDQQFYWTLLKKLIIIIFIRCNMHTLYIINVYNTFLVSLVTRCFAYLVLWPGISLKQAFIIFDMSSNCWELCWEMYLGNNETPVSFLLFLCSPSAKHSEFDLKPSLYYHYFYKISSILTQISIK